LIVPSGPDRDDFPAVVMAACPAQIVGPLQLATVRAFLECLDPEGIMAAAHATP
jgi:hypothetical protein